MAEAQKAAAAAQTKQQDVSLLDQIVNTMSSSGAAEQRAFARDAVAEVVNEALKGTLVFAGDTERMLKLRIAQLDTLISAQLNEVMHAPEFQRLEAAWRGLQYLVEQTPSTTNLKIKVLNVSKKELHEDLRRNDFDQSNLWKKVYEEEFGVFGGHPFGMLVGDYEFGNGPQDLDLLERLATVAGNAHTPFISSAAPKMFGLESYTELGSPKSIASIFEGQEYAKWRSFRESEHSRLVGLTAPRMLLRLPYTADDGMSESFNFSEEVASNHEQYLWGNSAYAFATRVTNSFSDYGWCTTIRGVESGGLVEGLPTHTFRTDAGDVAMKCPTEIAISDRREKELADAGFISLVHCKGRDFAAFFGAQSVNQPKTYGKATGATANAKLSSQLQYTFATCRFAHYMKAIMRDKVGGFMSRKEAEDFLNTWISEYVTIDDSAPLEVKAKYPLREAEITVEEIPGKPGAYRAVAFLKPHYQLEEIDISLRLVAELPQPANA